MKKRVLSFLTMLAMLVNLLAVMASAVGENANVLDGKKILMVGCSYTYYGGTVIPAGGNNNGGYTQAERANDTGFLYQLCKANGAEVNVTDWTFGGHSLKNILGGSCAATTDHKNKNYNHLDDLTDRYYDYVVIQDVMNKGGESKTDIADIESKIDIYVDMVKEIIEMFREANPNVQFYYGLYTGLYTNANSTSDALPMSIERIKDLGVTILDWGTLTYDVANGVTEVPGATQPYNIKTFLVGTDTYHQNILAGYLYALMIYCAITGESAVGQPYDFCYDENHAAYPISDRFEIENYVKTYYTSAIVAANKVTNFPEVLKSAADMEGLQKLVDEYLKPEKEAWVKYLHTVNFNANGGSDVGELTIFHEHTLSNAKLPTPRKIGDAFVGWYKDEALTAKWAGTEKVTADTTLYAAWEIAEYDVTFETNGGSAVESMTVRGDSTIDELPTPTKDGVTFGGWYADKELNTKWNETDTVTRDMTLYAAWNYTAAFETDGGSAVESMAVCAGKPIDELPTPTKDGVIFGGWYTDEALTTKWNETDVVTGDMTLYAAWEYTVVFENEDGSQISSQNYHYGEEVIPPAEAPKKADDTHTYTFAGWDKEVTVCTGNATYTATYTAEILGSTVAAIVGIAAAALVVLGLVGFFIFRFVGKKKK